MAMLFKNKRTSFWKKINTSKALTARFGNVSTGKSKDFKHIKALGFLFKHIFKHIKALTENSMCL